MARVEASAKHIAISRAQAQMVAVVAVSAFITVFCLIACKAVLSQNQYQARVTKAKEQANQQLKKNISAFNNLVESYKTFDTADPNVINGSLKGTGDNDGSNSKIILDALPSSYDFPALTSSLEKILTDRHFKVSGISGTDDQLSQQNNTSSSSPEAVSIPFTVEVSDANYASIQQLVTTLQQSIRPIQIDSLDMNGGASSMTINVSAHTYFQPSKSLNITKKEVK
jgi:hypothetical protein